MVESKWTELKLSRYRATVTLVLVKRKGKNLGCSLGAKVIGWLKLWANVELRFRFWIFLFKVFSSSNQFSICDVEELPLLSPMYILAAFLYWYILVWVYCSIHSSKHRRKYCQYFVISLVCAAPISFLKTTISKCE